MCEPVKLEPQTDNSIAAFDIRAFIDQLDEPARAICHAIINEGTTPADVAKATGSSTAKVMHTARLALIPIAREFDVRNSIKKYQHLIQITDK